MRQHRPLLEFCGWALSLFVMVGPAAAQDYMKPYVNEDGVTRVPPLMPPQAKESGHCTLSFTVGETGRPEDIRSSFCTDNLFEPAAIASVEKWEYPDKFIGDRLESQLTFRLADEKGDIIPEAETPAFDIQDRAREATDPKIATYFPIQVLGKDDGTEAGFCCMTFDVSQLGNPINVAALSCSDTKHYETSAYTVRMWRFLPGQMDGEFVSTSGHEAIIRFFDVPETSRWIRDPQGYAVMAEPDANTSGVCQMIG